MQWKGRKLKCLDQIVVYLSGLSKRLGNLRGAEGFQGRVEESESRKIVWNHQCTQTQHKQGH